jgi:hypothetical protein
MAKFYKIREQTDILDWLDTNFKTNERNIHNNMNTYYKIVGKNITNTKDNIKTKLEFIFLVSSLKQDNNKLYYTRKFNDYFYNNGTLYKDFRKKYSNSIKYQFLSEKERNNIHYYELKRMIIENKIEDVIFIDNIDYYNKYKYLYYEEYDIFKFLRQLKKDKSIIEHTYKFKICNNTLVCLDTGIL